ncbi:hypothetical protein ACROSR_19985 [Roseovarius tibetensis]|uniref:hypothetical protein n=1 Tax=Roseovarius tibetensis TaxID=2685897 RepID=UPI003D7F9A48
MPHLSTSADTTPAILRQDTADRGRPPVTPGEPGSRSFGTVFDASAGGSGPAGRRDPASPQPAEPQDGTPSETPEGETAGPDTDRDIDERNMPATDLASYPRPGHDAGQDINADATHHVPPSVSSSARTAPGETDGSDRKVMATEPPPVPDRAEPTGTSAVGASPHGHSSDLAGAAIAVGGTTDEGRTRTSPGTVTDVALARGAGMAPAARDTPAQPVMPLGTVVSRKWWKFSGDVLRAV